MDGIKEAESNLIRGASNPFEVTLRPRSFSEYIGQSKVKENLKISIAAAKKRGEAIDHILFFGPPGLGKTTLATVIANEMGVNLRATSGPAIERAGDLASILTNLEDRDILFIDEIHRLSRVAEEILYSAMEDYQIDLVIGKGPSAKPIKIDLPAFTLLGATTKPSSLSSPLRDRFGAVYSLDFYEESEIAKIIMRSAKILGLALKEVEAGEISRYARFTPRVANRLLKRIRDYATVKNNGTVNMKNIKEALAMVGIDEQGLDSVDRKILCTLAQNFGGGPTGLSTLSAAISEEAEAIEEVYEPYLIRRGFLERTARGRKLTTMALEKFMHKKGMF